MTKWFWQQRITICIAALIASIAWTFISISPEPESKPAEATVRVIPQYHIITRKSLRTWPAGTVFEPGMAAYFYAAEPRLDITPIIQATGMEQGLIHGTIESEMALQAIDDKSRAFWSYPIEEIVAEEFSLSLNIPQQTDMTSHLTSGLSVAFPETYQLLTQISDELQFYNGLFQLVMTSRIHIQGTINGIAVDKKLEQNLPVTLQQVSFSIPKPQDAISQVSFTTNMDSESPQTMMDILRTNYFPLSVNLILLLLLIFLLLSRQRNKPKAAIEHKRFKEWITEGIVDAKDKTMIHILSLEGLVDLAIDLDKRVIYDSRVSKYYVLAEDMVYVYDPVRPHTRLEKQQLGKLLLERGLIQPEQLEIGLYYQKKFGRRLGESLIALGFIDEITLYSTLAAQQKIDYYELNPADAIADLNWLNGMRVQRARALMALPLGKRSDGQLVVASSELSREGTRKALEEIFGSDIYLVAARPSVIFQALEQIDAEQRKKSTPSSIVHADKEHPARHLTGKEEEQFLASWYRGHIIEALLLKASGLVFQDRLNEVPEQEALLPWLVNKNIIQGEVANLLKGLDKAVQAMEWQDRQRKKTPGLLELLVQSNYICAKTEEWINQELPLQGLPLEQLLHENHLVSKDTVNNALLLLDTLKNLLTKA